MQVEGKGDLVVRSGRISDGVMPYTANGLYSLRRWWMLLDAGVGGRCIKCV